MATRRLKERAQVNIVIIMLMSVDGMEEGNILPPYLALTGLSVVSRSIFYHQHTAQYPSKIDL